MEMDKFSNLGSFEEMAEAQEAAPETAKTVEAEITTEAKAEEAPAAEAKADNVETPKTV